MAAEQQADYFQFETPAVRDLAWVFASQPVLLGGGRDSLWQSPADAVDFYDELNPHLQVLDKAPGALHERLAGLRTRRLGERFEALVAFGFDLHPRYQILQRNFPLRAHGRTLGEFDLIVEEIGKHTWHYELAIKYYLQYGKAENIGAWIGPSPEDRLLDKRNKLQGKQIRLSQLEEAKQLLAGEAIEIDGARIMLKGYLFRRRGDAQRVHGFEQENPRADHGLWLPLNEFDDWLATQAHGFRWLAVPKPHWLGPRRYEEICDEAEVVCMTESLQRREINFPVHVIGFDTGGKLCRLFVVPDTWPAIPL